MPMRCHEDIIVFYRKPPKYTPQERKGDSHSKTTDNVNHKNQCYGRHKFCSHKGKTLVMPSSIVTFQKEHSRETWHPTQKPVNLLRWLIRSYTQPGEVVLDCCIGSGTTAVAAFLEKRHFIGFELDETYCTKAMERVGEVRKSPLLL